jgi:hypothetical protein
MDETAKRTGDAERGYEASQISVGRLFAFAGGVAGLVIFGVVASAVAFHFFVRHQSLGPPATPFENVRQLPPEPRLQTEAPRDLHRYRESQDRILSSYGWVDRNSGTVRIPIDRAMEILLHQGLPVRKSVPVEVGTKKTPRAAAGTEGKS